MKFCWRRKASVASSLVTRIASKISSAARSESVDPPLMPKISSAARSKAVDPLMPAPFSPSSSSSSFVSLLFSRRAKSLSSSFLPYPIAKRVNFSAGPEIHHFCRKPRWYQNRRAVFIVVGVVVVGVLVVVGEATIAVLNIHLEDFPYSRLEHLLLTSPEIERLIGEIKFQKLKSELGDEILPPLHPDSTRVQRVCELQQDLENGLEPSKHLEGLNREVLLVEDNTVDAFCLPGGKIVVFTGLLDNFTRDAEIAAFIGHQDGHIVARHVAERIKLAMVKFIMLRYFAML